MVIDELIVKEDGIDKNVDSADNKTIDLIHVDGVDYHFAKESAVDGTAKATCYEAVKEPIIDMRISGNSVIADKEYTQVTHLESTGTQYIDTGYRPNQNTKVYAKFQLTAIGANYPFGSRSSSQSKICYVAGGASNWTLRFGATSSLAYGVTDTELHEVEMSLAGVYFDKQFIGTTDQAEFTCDGNLYIFGMNQKGSFYSGKTLIFALRLWESGKLIHDYVPCYRNSDHVAGLYDNVTKTFHTNDGTGEFIIGSEVSSPSTEMPVNIESVGDRTYNLLNPDDVEDVNQYVNANSGALMTPSSAGGLWRVSSYIRIEGGKTYHLNAINNDAWTAGMAWYDASKTYISGIPTGTTNLTGGKMPAPENAFYMRVSWRIEEGYNPDWQNTVQVVEGDTAKEFEPYGYKVPISIPAISNVLPNEYTQVEYIQNTGLQYIDTGYFDTKETKVELDFVYTDLYYNQTTSYYTGANAGNLVVINEQGYMGVAGSTSTEILATKNERYNITLYRDINNLRSGVINGIELTGTVGSSYSTIPFMLFSLGGSETASRICYKLYSCKIYYQDTLVRDFVPCYRKGDNVAGLYDLVEKKFYTNNGTGEFLVGENIKQTTTIYLKEPLRKIGDFADYIDYKNKKVVRNVEAYVFKEPDSDWLVFADSVTEKTMGVYYRNSEKLGSYGSPAFKNNSQTMCNAFKYQSGAGIHNANDSLVGLFMTAANSSPPYFGFRVPYTTMAEWKAKITELNDRGTPLTVYVVRATPMEEPIDIPELFTYDGTNYFAVETSIEPTAMSVNYWEQITPEQADEIIQEGGNILIISTGAEITQEGTNLIIGG